MANTIEIVIKAKDDASKVLSGIGGHVETLGKLALGGLGAAVGAAAGFGAALAKLAVDAAPLEGIQNAFGGLAESAGVGMDDMLAALKRGSSGMITNRELMLSFNKAAQLVSVDFATRLPDAMSYLGKVSAATGQDMGFMMDSLVTGVGRLSPMILDNLGIQVDVTQANADYAAVLGKTAAELTKTEQQTALMNQVMEKLAVNTANMPAVTETAAAKMARLKATFQDTKDQIGMAFLPILTEVIDTFAALAERFLPPLIGFLERLAESIRPIVEALGAFIARLAAGTDPLTAFKVLLMELLPPQLFFSILNIVTGIEAFMSKVGEALAPVMAWLAENVKLQDVLLALGVAIATIVVPALGGIIAAAAPVIAIFLAAVAIVTALRLAWENDFLGMRTTLTEFWEGSVKPALAALWNWLSVNIPAAITTLKGFWESTLLPAIQKVWGFIQNDLLPLFETLKEFMNVALTLALTALAGLWEKVLQPALKAVWEWISTKILPIFDEIKTKVEGPLGDALKWLNDTILGPLTKSFGGISGAVQDVMTWIGKLTEELRKVKLPDWLTPGSPTPFELGLRGIGAALAQLSSTELPRLALGLQLAPVGAAAGVGMGARPGAGATNHIYIERLVLDNVQNAPDLLARLQELI